VSVGRDNTSWACALFLAEKLAVILILKTLMLTQPSDFCNLLRNSCKEFLSKTDGGNKIFLIALEQSGFDLKA